MINKIWNIAHFQGTFVLSFNQPFLDSISPIIGNRLFFKFCYRDKNGISVTVIDRDDACIISDSIEQSLNNGLRDGALIKFYERLSEQLRYIASQNSNKYSRHRMA